MPKFIKFLLEGITHIEDLDVDELVSVLKNLSKYIATEKLDGAALTFGLDVDGKLYCSRQQKGSAIKKYDPESWGDGAAGVGFKSAHTALIQVADKLRTVVPVDVLVEVEVLFGAQPNAIIYGNSCIAFLRALSPKSDAIISAIKNLNLASVSVDTLVVSSPDGETITRSSEQINWRFTTPQQLDSQSLAMIDFSEQIAELEHYLATVITLDTGATMTVRELIRTKQRTDEIKNLKQQIADVITHNFRLPVKQSLLNNFVRKLTPTLRDSNLTVDRDIDPGVEGVVLFDPSTNTQVKIVDKDVFTAFNNFNFAVRSQLKSAIPKQIASELKLIDTETGSVYSDLLAALAVIFEQPSLARPTTIRKFLASRPEFHVQDLSETKHAVLAALQTTLSQARHLNSEFRNVATELKTQASDRTFKYSPEIISRTLSMSAEIITELKQTITVVTNATNITEVISAVYKSFLTDK